MTAPTTSRPPGIGLTAPGEHGAPFGAALEDDMAYKGDDLDLRAPQSPVQAPPYSNPAFGPLDAEQARQRVRANGQYQNGPQRSPALYVDETLLACCNHAHDIASANGAREVLIEHLIHAFTRVPEAAQLLENRGVHVMALRRESATIIANDLPISPSHSGQAVKASGDFDAILHLAAANARLRSERPTSVGDVLFVLMNYDRQTSGIELLRRHWTSWQEEPYRQPPAQPALERVQVRQPVFEQSSSIDRAEVQPTRVDRFQDARIEALFNALQDSVLAQRTDYQNLRATLGERMQRLEKSFEHGRIDGGAATLEVALTSRLQRLEKMQESLLSQRVSLAPLEAAMNDRFHRLEKALETSRFDQSKLPTDVHDRLQATERLFEAKITESMRGWGAIGEQLKGLERAIEISRQELSGASTRVPAPLLDRLDALEGTLVGWREDGGAAAASGDIPGVIFERLQSMERAIAQTREETMRLAKTNETTVAELRAGVTRLGSSQQSITTAIDQWRLDNTGDLGIISNRLEAIEHSSVRPMEILESLNARVQAMGLQQTALAQPYPTQAQYSAAVGTATVVRPMETTESSGRRRGFWRWLFGLS